MSRLFVVIMGCFDMSQSYGMGFIARIPDFAEVSQERPSHNNRSTRINHNII
jgi:hypothetical protein